MEKHYQVLALLKFPCREWICSTLNPKFSILSFRSKIFKIPDINMMCQKY